MNKFRFLTAGESHGKCLTAIIEGIPAGFEISEDFINSELKRRQGGYGRGGRMKIETDTVEININLNINDEFCNSAKYHDLPTEYLDIIKELYNLIVVNQAIK